MSCSFMPRTLVRHFHVLQFHALHFQRPAHWSVIFMSCIFSAPIAIPPGRGNNLFTTTDHRKFRSESEYTLNNISWRRQGACTHVPWLHHCPLARLGLRCIFLQQLHYKCSRLSQPNWFSGALYYSHSNLLTYLV